MYITYGYSFQVRWITIIAALSAPANHIVEITLNDLDRSVVVLIKISSGVDAVLKKYSLYDSSNGVVITQKRYTLAFDNDGILYRRSHRMKKRYILTLVAIFSFLFTISLENSVRAHSKDDPNRWMAPENMAHRKNPVSNTPESIQKGKGLYQKHCTLCHGIEGRGDGPAARGLKPKPSNLVAMSGMHEDGDVAWKIAEGRGVMPGFKERFNSEQIWDLVNFIQSLKATDEKN